MDRLQKMAFDKLDKLMIKCVKRMALLYIQDLIVRGRYDWSKVDCSLPRTLTAKEMEEERK